MIAQVDLFANYNGVELIEHVANFAKDFPWKGNILFEFGLTRGHVIKAKIKKTLPDGRHYTEYRECEIFDDLSFEEVEYIVAQWIGELTQC